jgi:integrase
MIAAGVCAKHLQTYLGHSSITTTLAIYGHLMPGFEEDAAGLLDAYLVAERERVEAAARAAGSDLTGERVGS